VTSRALPKEALCAANVRIPGPRGWRLWRALRDMRHDRLDLVMRMMHEYGDVVLFRVGPRRLVLTTHPAAVRHVLVEAEFKYRKGLGLSDARALLGDGLLTSERQLWASRRAALHGSFGAAALDTMAPAIVESASRIASAWDRAGEDQVDVGRDMLRLALEAFAIGLLKVDRRDLRELRGRPDGRDEGDSLLEAFATVETWAMAQSVALLRTPAWMPHPGHLKARRAIATLEAFAYRQLAAARRACPSTELPAVLLALADQGPATGSPESSTASANRAARDEFITLLLAGHETVAASLAWTWLSLSTHPEVEKRVHHELDKVLGGRMPTMADVGRLTYTRSVIEETLRLHPPVWLIPRKAIVDDRVCGYEIPAGTDLLISVYGLHRHPRYWTEADSFNPDRFRTDAGVGRLAGLYIPFGVGPRTCLGSRLAIGEVLLALAVLASRYRVRWARAEPLPPDPSLTLRFPNHVGASVVRR
jgi:enediyne biosynthesis protein E7